MGEKVFASAVNWSAVTPSDTTIVTCHALYVGTGGTVVVAPATGAGTSFVNVADGTWLPVELKQGRVMAATSASNIIAVGW
jgi:hypothetical protein